jgi:hypothetical protein
MLAPLLSLATLLLGLALILGDGAVGSVVHRRARVRDPESGAVSARALGIVLFVAGGVAFLAWAP